MKDGLLLVWCCDANAS